MKKLLFVIPSLSAGGGEKSLVNLLSQINYQAINVDLFLFNKTGVFVNSIPREVNIIEPGDNYKTFGCSLKPSVLQFLKNNHYYLAYSRLMFTIKNRLIRNTSMAEQSSWKYQRNAFNTLETEYDLAIGFLEKSSIYFVVDKVKAKKKVGWIHTNYTNSGMNPRYDQAYFDRLNNLVTVSEECALSLEKCFPNLKNKIRVILNIVSPPIIEKLSEEIINENCSIDKKDIHIVTIARLSHEKGIDMAINACEILVNKGYNIIWSVLGEGNERGRLETLINRKNLDNSFKLLGIKGNPYPYLRKADIYVQPSRYEGKSIAIDEAKILRKPIVVSNYPSAKDQIKNGINGMIVEMNEDSLSKGIEELIKNENLKANFISNLSNEPLGTEEEIRKLYEIFSG